MPLTAHQRRPRWQSRSCLPTPARLFHLYANIAAGRRRTRRTSAGRRAAGGAIALSDARHPRGEERFARDRNGSSSRRGTPRRPAPSASAGNSAAARRLVGRRAGASSMGRPRTARGCVKLPGNRSKPSSADSWTSACRAALTRASEPGNTSGLKACRARRLSFDLVSI